MDSSEDIATMNDGARHGEFADSGDGHKAARIVDKITGVTAIERLSKHHCDSEILRIIEAAVPIVGPAIPRQVDQNSDAETTVRDDIPSPTKPRALGFDVNAINRDYALVLAGAKAVVVKEQLAGPVEDRVRMISLEAFNAWFANCPTEYLAPDGQSIRTTTWAKAWLAHRQRRQYVSIEFHPNPDGAPGTPGYLNLWRGFGVEPSDRGSYSIFRDHLLTNVCSENKAHFDWLFAWFARIFQRPRERAGTSVVLRGKMGSGKSKVGEVFGSLIPAHYSQVDDPRYVTGQFNAHMACCLLLQADEGFWAGDKTALGRIKGLITSETQMIESKGIDAIKMKNFVNLLTTSNEGWVVPAGKEERRYFVLDVDPRCASNHDYFREMDAQLAAGGREKLLYDLLQFDLSKIKLRQIPQTEALLEQKIRSLESMDSWWLSRLQDGTITGAHAGWDTTVVCDALYADFLRFCDDSNRRKIEKPTFGINLLKLVPGLKKVRLPEREIEGKRKRPWGYGLTSLSDCRQGFENSMGQPISWPAPLGEEATEAFRAGEDDDVIPA